ncbi:MAG: DUF1963 domain-containing protein, partial [Bifidobacteriaceae bacterium]|nr:DUF1963 domain-containing protein [Bifidobacteriaceae bacterium]
MSLFDWVLRVGASKPRRLDAAGPRDVPAAQAPVEDSAHGDSPLGEAQLANAAPGGFGTWPPTGQALAELREDWLAATGAPAVRLTVVPGEVGLLDSKLGGQPYLPPGVAWPTGAGNPDRPLFLLAQLNLGELPALAGLPSSGLLQFFIAAGETHGMDLRNLAAGSGHAVLYHPVAPVETDAVGLVPSDASHPTRPDPARAIERLDLPFSSERPVALAGEAVTDPLSHSDFGFAATARELLARDPA